MPREQINFPKRRELLTSDSDGNDSVETLNETLLHVTWIGPDVGGHVQVALEMDTRSVEHAIEEQEKLFDGRDPRSGKDNVLMWYTPVLDRAEINRLITILRTARDKAYGKDA